MTVPNAPVVLSSSLTSSRGPDRLLGRLAGLVSDVVTCLESRPGALGAAIADCNDVIELYLERQREPVRRELEATAHDDLQRLVRMLSVAERADVPFVLRQIRRVLGRLDA